MRSFAGSSGRANSLSHWRGRRVPVVGVGVLFRDPAEDRELRSSSVLGSVLGESKGYTDSIRFFVFLSVCSRGVGA